MIGKFTEGLSPKEVREFLQNHAETITESGTYYKPLTEEEIEERRLKFAEAAMQVNDLEAGKKLAVEAFKGKIKPIQEANGIRLDEIRTRQQQKRGILYDVKNHEDGVMETYNEQGEFISSRRLRPDERDGNANVFAFPVAQ